MIQAELISKLNSIYEGLGTQIDKRHKEVVDIINAWEPEVTQPVTDVKTLALIRLDELGTEVVKLFSTGGIDSELAGENKDTFIAAVDLYTNLYTSLMQFVSMPNFDYNLVASLKDIPTLPSDDVFYIFHAPLHTHVDRVLANNITYIGDLLNIFDDNVSIDAFISITDLNSWANSLNIVEGEVVETYTFPAAVYKLVKEIYSEDSEKLMDINTINTRIQSVISEIINYITFNDFKETPVFLEGDKKPIPKKSDLKEKVYTKHRLRLFREFCGLTSPEEEKEEEVTRDNILI